MDKHKEVEVLIDRSSHKNDYAKIVDRLDHRASVIRRRLAVRLQSVWELHDLGITELLAAQSQTARQANPPTAAEFWAVEALPRAHTLREPAVATINAELDQFAEHVERFHQSLRLLARPRRDDELGRRGRQAALTAGHGLIEAMPQPAINDVGSKWQRRLHRASRRRNFFTAFGASPAEAEFAVARLEMEMLSSAPWCYGDRMLSAMEMTHTDIANHFRSAVVRIVDRHSWPTEAPAPRSIRELTV